MSDSFDDLQDEIKASFEERLKNDGYSDQIAAKYAKKWAKTAVNGLQDDLNDDG